MRNPDANLYDSDFYLWTQRAAEDLRAGKLAAEDLEYAAEEIADMGKRDRRELQSRMRVLIMHLIEWAAQSQMRESSTWLNTIIEQRAQIEDVLEQSPSLRGCLATDLPSIYVKAARDAATETRIPLSDLKSHLTQGGPLPADALLCADFFPERLSDLRR